MSRRPSACCLLLLAACAASPSAPPPSGAGGLTVAGNVPHPGHLTQADLEALGAEDVRWTFRDQDHVYRGVPLDRLLTQAGFEPGAGGASVPPRERRPGWRNVVIATGADGFYSVFTCAELMPDMGATRAFVVWSRDGAPLPADEGPLRIVVTTDHKGSRSARQLTALRVVELKSPQATDRR